MILTRYTPGPPKCFRVSLSYFNCRCLGIEYDAVTPVLQGIHIITPPAMQACSSQLNYPEMMGACFCYLKSSCRFVITNMKCLENLSNETLNKGTNLNPVEDHMGVCRDQAPKLDIHRKLL